MATIYWRNGLAYLNWREGGKRYRLSLGACTPKEAETFRQTKEVELATGQQILSRARTLGQFVPEYLVWYEAHYPSSYWRTEQILTQVFAPLHPLPLDLIDAGRLERIRAVRLNERAPGTVLKEFRCLGAAMQRAVRWKWCRTNPVRDMDPLRETTEKRPHYFHPDELQRLYGLGSRWAPVWKLLANTGLRSAEARQLKWTDVRGGSLQIESRVGARTKSGKGRTVPLSPGAIEALGMLPRETEYVLPIVTDKALSKACKRDLQRAGLGGSLHSLRHTFASALVASGVPLRTVQRLLGHASVRTTERYAHVREDALEAAVRGLSL